MDNSDEIKVGDPVEIVLYGAIQAVFNEEGGLDSVDGMPSLVGQRGTVDKIIGTRFPKYYVKGLIGKYGPFNKEQLNLIP